MEKDVFLLKLKMELLKKGTIEKKVKKIMLKFENVFVANQQLQMMIQQLDPYIRQKQDKK